MRLQVSGVPRLVKIGYRGPRSARALHPSGYVDVLVFNKNDLAKIDPGKDAIRISHTVGRRKREEIMAEAIRLNLKVLNPRKAKGEQIKPEVEQTTKQESEPNEANS